MERKLFRGEVKGSDDERLIVEAVITTEHRDRVGDIVRASGMKVRGKPVVLLGHGRESMGSEPIAKPLSIRQGEHNGEKGIVARTQFYPDETGKRLFRKVKENYINAWSIGFSIVRSIPLTGGGRDIREWDLLEYSLVGVPANPHATTLKSLAFGIAEAGTCCGKCTKEGSRCAGHRHRDPVTTVIPLSAWRWSVR